SVAGTYKNGPFTAIAAYEFHQNVNRHGDDGLENPALAAPIFLPDGSQVFTGVADEWAAKVGGGYRFDNPLGSLQLYAMYEWIRREVAPGFDPFTERSKDDFFVSATQRVGQWAFSASYIHASGTPGAPACLSLNNPNAGVGCVSPGPIVQIGQFQQNAFSEASNQYNAGIRYFFNNWASMYLVG